MLSVLQGGVAGEERALLYLGFGGVSHKEQRGVFCAAAQVVNGRLFILPGHRPPSNTNKTQSSGCLAPATPAAYRPLKLLAAKNRVGRGHHPLAHCRLLSLVLLIAGFTNISLPPQHRKPLTPRNPHSTYPTHPRAQIQIPAVPHENWTKACRIGGCSRSKEYSADRGQAVVHK